MEHVHPLYRHSARGWVHNVDNRKNCPYYFAQVESQKIDPAMNPQRSLSVSEINIRERPYRYTGGIENRRYSWYTYRDGTGRNLVQQTTVTTTHSGPVTYTTRLRECQGRSGAYVCL